MMNRWLAVRHTLVLMIVSLLTLPVMASTNDTDPFEPVNRRVFQFNDVVDRFFLKPIAKSYIAITPAFLRAGVSNFFNNVGEFGNAANNLLQGKPKEAGKDSLRLVVNTTVGLFGFMDAASRFGLDSSTEDFGQTLGAWGIEAGPFLVLPFLGPSTMRDGLGLTADTLVSPYELIEDHKQRYGIRFAELVDTRVTLLDAERNIVGDRYTFVRDAYLQRRDYLVRDGKLADDGWFEDDFDDGFFD